MVDDVLTGKPEKKVSTTDESVSDKAKPEAGKVEASKPKVVRYNSRRANFRLCVRQREVHRDDGGHVVKEIPGKFAQFSMNTLTTSDEEVIARLDAYIASPDTSSDEVFRVPEIDELLDGDVSQRLDNMQLDELRAACRQRGVDVRSIDDEGMLRYKLLKKVTGFGGEKK